MLLQHKYIQLWEMYGEDIFLIAIAISLNFNLL